MTRAIFLVVLHSLRCNGGAPNPPVSNPYYYPFDVPVGTYPCDWQILKNSSDPSSTWAGKNFQHQRSTSTSMESWPGLGYVAWTALVDKNVGEKGGNVWSVKLGNLPCSQSYRSEVPVTVSQFDRIHVMVEAGFELVRFADKTAFDSCDMSRTQDIGVSPADYVAPSRVSDAFVEQGEYACKKDGVLNPWACSTKISSAAKDIDINPLNPNGKYTESFKKVVNIGFMSSHVGKTLYFADKTRCGNSIKFQVTVQAGKIVFLPWTEHVERFEYNGWLQQAYDKGLTVDAEDEVWFATATYEHNVYQVFDKTKWTGTCPALGKVSVSDAEAKQLDIASERLLYYPSNSPNARHLWKFKAAQHLKTSGAEAYLGCWNVYHECCCLNNNFTSPPPCAVTHCNMGPAGGQRILIRRSVATPVATGTSAASVGPLPFLVVPLAGALIAAMTIARSGMEAL